MLASRRLSRARRRPASPIGGIEAAEATGALVFHAGTALRDGQLVTAGGRVLERDRRVGESVAEAREQAYRAVEQIDFPGAQYRRDIALAGRPCPSLRNSRIPLTVLEEFEDAGPLVGILIGSESDREAMEPAIEELDERGISNELDVLSAHRDPRGVAEYASTAALRGMRVIIAGAGMAAALPGVVAAYTELPVIGVPLTSSKSVHGRARRPALDRADAAGRAGRLRLRQRRAQRGHPRGQDPRPGRRLPGDAGPARPLEL